MGIKKTFIPPVAIDQLRLFVKQRNDLNKTFVELFGEKFKVAKNDNSFKIVGKETGHVYIMTPESNDFLKLLFDTLDGIKILIFQKREYDHKILEKKNILQISIVA